MHSNSIIDVYYSREQKLSGSVSGKRMSTIWSSLEPNTQRVNVVTCGVGVKQVEALV